MLAWSLSVSYHHHHRSTVQFNYLADCRVQILQHLADLAKAEGYLRTTRYKLIWGRNSDTSRALKTGSSEDKTEAQPAATPARLPEWFALHEFETDKVDIAELQRQLTDWTKKIFANCDEFEIGQMRLDKAFGEKGIFDGEDV